MPFLYIVCMVTTAIALEMPQKSLSAAEVADPSQDGAEKKAWVNVLQIYGQFRQTAKALIKDINAVMDLAWSAQKQLESIQAVASRVESISQYVQKYNYESATQLVKDMEEGVFQQSDLLLFNDLPNVSTCYKDLSDSRDRILKLGTDQGKAVWATSKKIYDATTAQFNRIFNTTKPPSSPQQALGEKTSSSTIASHTADQVALDNQSVAITQQTQQITDSAGNLTPEQMAESNLENQRNRVLVNYQYHEYEAGKIQNLSLLLLEKTKRLDDMIYNKEQTVDSYTPLRDGP